MVSPLWRRRTKVFCAEFLIAGVYNVNQIRQSCASARRNASVGAVNHRHDVSCRICSRKVGKASDAKVTITYFDWASECALR